MTLSSTEIGGIIDFSLASSVGAQLRGAGGSLVPTHTSVMRADPVLSFTTLDIKAMLDITGLQASVSSGDVEAYFRPKLVGGEFSVSADYVKMTIHDSIIIPRALSAPGNDQPAIIRYDVFAIDDESSGAITIISNSAAPAGPGLNPQEYVMGPVDVNTTEIQPQSWSLDLGLDVQALRHAGNIFPLWAGVMARNPVFSLQTLDLSKLALATPDGVPVTASTWYLRKKIDGAGNEADAAIEHIKITTTDGILIPGDASASQGGLATLELRHLVEFDGSNAILVLNTAVAIT